MLDLPANDEASIAQCFQEKKEQNSPTNILILIL